MSGSTTGFLRIVRWEWRLASAGGASRVALVVIAVLTALALGSGWAATRARRSVIERMRVEQVERFAFLRAAFTPGADPDRVAGRPLSREERAQARTLQSIGELATSVAYFGGNGQALFAPSTLAPLAIGQSDLWPDRYSITAWSKRSNLEREDIANPAHQAAGPFDLATVVVVVLPLVLIALTYDLISSDREAGTLALTLSQPVGLGRVVLAKLLVRAVPPVAAVLALAAIGLIAGGADLFAKGVAARFALWALAVVLYGAFWAVLAVAVNASGRSSVANGVLLVGCWIVLVLVVPSALGHVASTLHPVPPESERITRERALRAEAEAEGEPFVARYFRAHPELKRVDRAKDPYNQTRWDAIVRDVDRRLQPDLERPRLRVREQIGFLDRWQWASPAVTAKAAMDDLSGTSLAHHLDFTALADRYHDAYMGFLHPKMVSRTELTPADYDRFPQFDDGGLGDRPHAGRVLGNLLCVTGWAVVVAVAGFLRLRGRISAA